VQSLWFRDKMRTKSYDHFLPLITLVVPATLMIGIIFAPSALLVYAQEDRSETNTEQAIAEQNVGNGESINENCSQNSIDSLATSCIVEEEEAPLPPSTCVECFTTILSTAEISSFEAALSLNTGGLLTTVADACASLETNDPPTTVAEARTFLISAGISPEHADELLDCLIRLGLFVATP
jgi:hypothetical protein